MNSQSLYADNIRVKYGKLQTSSLKIKSDVIQVDSGTFEINSKLDGIVQIESNITGNGIIDIGLNNDASYIKGWITSPRGFVGTHNSVKLQNGARWDMPIVSEEDADKLFYSEYSSGTRYSSLPNLESLNANDSFVNIGMIANGTAKNITVDKLSGNNSEFNFSIYQDTQHRENINSSTLTIGYNATKGATHTISLSPIQADFLVQSGQKINPFTVVKDESIGAKEAYEAVGGSLDAYPVNFKVKNFDAGVYNYTPTLTKVTAIGYDEWKITDIAITGSASTPAPEPTPEPEPTPIPDPTPAPGPTIPVISNLAHNISNSARNNFYRFRNEYNNINKRLGDLRMSSEPEGWWVRNFTGTNKSDRYGIKDRYSAFQLGYDKRIDLKENDKFFLGGAVTYYTGMADFAHQGCSENRSRGLAVYASYLGNKGHYADVIIRQSKLTSEVDSYASGTGAKTHGDVDNWGTSVGFEYGRKIPLKSNFFIQPEVELIYGHISGANYTMSDGTKVSQSSIDSWTVRTGLTIGQSFDDNSYYISANYNHDFCANGSVSISDKYGGTYFASDNLSDSWWSINAGGSAKISTNTYCYLDLEKSFGGSIDKNWQVNAGIRISF